MGNDYPGQEEAIDKFRRHLSPEEKEVLSHHLRNSLSGIIGGLQAGDYKIAEDSAWHMVGDLNKFGI